MVSNGITILIIFLVLVGTYLMESLPFHFSKQSSESTKSGFENNLFYRCLYQPVSYETEVMKKSLSITLNISLDKKGAAKCYGPEFYITLCSKIICQTSLFDFENKSQSYFKTFNASHDGY